MLALGTESRMGTKTRKHPLDGYRRRNKKLRRVGFESYAAYLQSNCWAVTRAKVLERDDGKCVACTAPATCVHHTNYNKRTLFARKVCNALVSLCRECHEAIEFHSNGTKVPMRDVGERLRNLCRRNGTTLPGRCPICLLNGKSDKYHGRCRQCALTSTSHEAQSREGSTRLPTRLNQTIACEG